MSLKSSSSGVLGKPFMLVLLHKTTWTSFAFLLLLYSYQLLQLHLPVI